MGKRLWLFLAACLLTVGMTFAQKTVTGKVIDGETGEPVIGASVFVQGTTLGKATDIDGNFTIQNVPNSAKNLRVTFVGMKEQIVAIKPKLRIYLQSMSTKIDETVVVAFGKTTKEAFTGSATTIKSEDIAQTQSTNALDAIKGKSAGVQMFATTGQPGASDPKIIIRGITSINAGNEPLIVVDGAVFHGDLNTINSSDIESMTVLKDAASNALYGARGANGVIMITTKKAKYGQDAKITFEAKWGSNSRGSRHYKTINNPAGYYEQYYKALYNYAVDNGEANPNAWANANIIDDPEMGLQYQIFNVPTGQSFIGTNGKVNPNATIGNVVNYNGQDYYLQNDNAWDILYGNGLRQEYTLTAQNANQNSNFYASFNYLNNEGITHNSGFERMTGRLKAENQLKSWLKMSANMIFGHYEGKNVDGDGKSSDSGNVFAYAQSVAPIYPMYVRDGQGNIMYDAAAGTKIFDYGEGDNAGLTRPVFGKSNALGSAYLDKNYYEGNNAEAVGALEARFLKDFKFTSTNTAYLQETRSTSMTNGFYGQYASDNGLLQKIHTRYYSYSFSQVLDWNHLFGKHDVSAMLGHEYDMLKSYQIWGYKGSMFDPGNTELGGAVNTKSTSSSRSTYNTEGYFGRAMYNYDQKYFGSISYRRDASSRFAKDNRWGGFFSLGGAWIISKEEWFPKSDILNYAKIKASYGENGNDQVGSLRFTNTYTITDSNGNAAILPDVEGNSNITWEKVKNFNVGVEFEMFKSRLRGSIEYFNRKTSDMLYYVNNPTSFGWDGHYDNVGDMRNAGVEISLDGDIIAKKDFTWTVFVNATTYKNKILKISDANKRLVVDGHAGYRSGRYFYGEGKSLYTFYLYKYAGVDPETGASQWWKTVTQDKLDADGNPIPVLDANGEYQFDADGNMIVETEKVQKKTSDFGELTDDDYHLCDNALPAIYGGFGTSLTWKNFDFSINFSYQIGGKVYDSSYQDLMANPQSGLTGHAIHADMLKAWSESNVNSNIPRYVYGDKNANATSDRFLTNASYLSINNINLGYTLPAALTRRAQIDRLRVFVSADNVFVWSKRQGMDPRQSITGAVNATYYSPIRTISGGVSVTF